MSALQHNVIISVNIDKQLELISEIAKATEQLNPIVITIQDPPKLTNSQRNVLINNYLPNMAIANFNSHHIILTHKDLLTCTPNNASNTNNRASSLSVEIKLKNTDANTYLITSIYIKPKADHTEIQECLEKIENLAKNSTGISRLIILGDTNSTSNLWAPISDIIPELTGIANYNNNNNNTYQQKRINRGQHLNNFINRTKLTCLNETRQGPTFTSKQGGRESYIDIILTGSKAIKTWSNYSTYKYSQQAQHHMISTYTPGPKYNSPYSDGINKYFCISPSRYNKAKKPRKITRYKRINELHYTQLNCSTEYLKHDWTKLSNTKIEEIMNRTTNLLYRHLLITQNAITANLKPINTTEPIAPHNQATLKGIMKQTRNNLSKIKRLQTKLITLKNKKPRNGMQIRKIKTLITKTKAKAVNSIEQELFVKTSNNKLEDLLLRNHQDDLASYNQHTDLWQTVKLAYKTIQQNNDMEHQHSNIITEQLTLNPQLLNNSTTNNDNLINNQEELEKVLMEKFPLKERSQAKELTIRFQTLKRELISNEEINKAIKDVRNKKYTGPEGLKFQTLVQSMPFITNIITQIAKMSFYTGQLPTLCYQTQGTLIPKKKPGQYRIVHVASPLTALLEIIALNRFEYALENQKLFNVKQYGFTALKGRHDLFARLMENIITNKKACGENAKTCIISLDIEGAFDNINQNAIISKLNQDLINTDQTALKWISNFILTRQIKITYNNMTSTNRQVCMGVPQGSSLGPILFNYTINNIDCIIRKTQDLECLGYADDLILISNNDKKLQNHQPVIDNLTNQLEKFDLKIKPEKCSYMNIINTSHDYNPATPTINNKEIEKVKKMTILGIPFTRNLKYDRNNSTINQKLQLNISKLTRLRQLNIINNKKEWNTLLQSYIYSLTIYNSYPILALDKGGRQYIDKIHTKAMRTIFAWPANASTKIINLITNCPLTDTATRNILETRMLTEHKQAHSLLKTILLNNFNTIKHQQISSIEKSIPPLEEIQKREWVRRYPNPTLYLKPTTQLPDQLLYTSTSFWVIDTIQEIKAIEITTGLTKLTIIIIDHYCNNSNNRYFKEATALWNVILRNDERKPRTWLTTENNTLLKALYNNNQSNWLIIRLRERMAYLGWSIVITTQQQQEHITKTLYDNSPNRRHIADVIQIKTTNPDYSQSWLKLYTKQKIEETKRIMIEHNHNYLTKHLDFNNKSWENYPPNMINSSNILMISELITRESGSQIEKADIPEPGETQPGCNSTCTRGQQSHPTLHRLLECNRFSQIRKDFNKALKKSTNITAQDMNKEPTTLTKAFENYRTRQTIIRYMTKCAFNKN